MSYAIGKGDSPRLSERKRAWEARSAFMLPFMTPDCFARLIAIGRTDPLYAKSDERMPR
jgi:hypothetical protein